MAESEGYLKSYRLRLHFRIAHSPSWRLTGPDRKDEQECQNQAGIDSLLVGEIRDRELRVEIQELRVMSFEVKLNEGILRMAAVDCLVKPL